MQRAQIRLQSQLRRLMWIKNIIMFDDRKHLNKTEKEDK